MQFQPFTFKRKTSATWICISKLVHCMIVNFESQELSPFPFFPFRNWEQQWMVCGTVHTAQRQSGCFYAGTFGNCYAEWKCKWKWRAKAMPKNTNWSLCVWVYVCVVHTVKASSEAIECTSSFIWVFSSFQIHNCDSSLVALYPSRILTWIFLYIFIFPFSYSFILFTKVTIKRNLWW